MTYDQSRENPDTALALVWHACQPVERRRAPDQDRQAGVSAAFRLKMGRDPIWLDRIEYAILTFLAARPYRAYTRRRIADAISTRRQPIAEDALDHHIASLRDKLGFFRDYIQSVPYIGYRFKA